MTHTDFSLDRVITEWKQAAVRRFADVPSPFNAPDSAHPTLFAVEPGPDDYEEAIREDERRAARQIQVGLINENLALKEELRALRDFLYDIHDGAGRLIHPVRN